MAASVEPVDNYRCAAFAGGKVLVMEGGDVEPRVSALEGGMREMRDFRRATVSSFNAVREDLVDLRGEVGELRAEMRSGFDLTATGQQQIVGMLQTLIDREDR